MKLLTRGLSVLAICGLLVGCSDSTVDRRNEADSEQFAPLDLFAEEVPDEGAALDRLAQSQQQLQELETMTATATVSLEEQVQNIELDVEIASDSFTGHVIAKDAAEEIKLEIIRANKITWIKGPAAYWESIGYNEDGARAAESKFVAFEMSAGDTIADPYKYGALIRDISNSPEETVQVIGIVEFDGHDAYRYQIGERGRSSYLDLPVNEEELERVRIASRSDTTEAVVVMTDFNDDQVIAMPSPEEVLQP